MGIIKRVPLKPGEFSVLTANLCEIKHDKIHSQCLGICDIGDLTSTRRSEPVFCICDCHKKPEEE